MGFCLISNYSDHPQPPVFGGAPHGWPTSAATTGGQVRQQTRQQAAGAGGRPFQGQTAGHTLSLQIPVQKVNFSIYTDRRDPPKLYEKDMEK